MYVLTVIHPPTGGAAYGKAVTLDPVSTRTALMRRVEYVLTTEAGADKSDALSFALTVNSVDPGWETTHGSGLAFRFDPADNAPHPCPCGGEDGEDSCGRLVLPTDHAYAYIEDAYCTGCFTWKRGDVQCLPANTAHPAEETP